MRVTNQSLSRQLTLELARSFDRVAEYRLQVITGRKLNTFSDDPTGVGLTRRYDALMATQDQYLRSVSNARSYLDAADGALQEMSGIMSRLRTVVQQELGAATNDTTRLAARSEVERLREELLMVVNQEVAGSRLFGGLQTGRDPFVLEAGQVRYRGDDQEQRVRVGPNVFVPVTLDGSKLLGSDRSVLSGRADLREAVTPATLLADLNDGAGVAAGSIRLQVASDPPVDVDLSGATTVGDVIAAINASGTGITAAISADGRSLELSAGSSIAVGEVNGGTTAQDLGIVGSNGTGSVTGHQLRPALGFSAQLADVASLGGQLPLGAVRIQVGGTTTVVDLSTATTMSDVKAQIEMLVPDIQVDLREGALVLRHTDGEPFTVDSPSGDSTAALLGIEGDGSAARMFDVFADIISALENADLDALRGTLGEISDVADNISVQNVAVGGWQQAVDRQELSLYSRRDALQSERSRIVDADLAEVATRLAFAETTYEAALRAASGVFELSLARFI